MTTTTKVRPSSIKTRSEPRRSFTAPAAPADRQDTPRATDDDIRSRAFAIYELRQALGEPGDALSDWIQAELELNGKNDKP